MRNGVEGPDQLAGAHVEGADIAGSRTVPLVGRRAENQQILEDAAGRGGLHQRERLRIAAQPFFQIDAAVGAEGEDRLAGSRIDRLQRVIARRTAGGGRSGPCFPSS